jgi:hypothetical protein
MAQRKPLRGAWTSDAKACDYDVQVTTDILLSDPMRVGYYLEVIRRTEYWREIGLKTFLVYLTLRYGKGRAKMALGAAWLYRLRAYKRLATYVAEGAIPIEYLADVGSVIEPGNVNSWIVLCCHLTGRQIKRAVRDSRAAKRHDNYDILLAFHVPLTWYRQVWAENRKENGWRTLQAILELPLSARTSRSTHRQTSHRRGWWPRSPPHSTYSRSDTFG